MYEEMSRDELVTEMKRSRERLGACTLNIPTLCQCLYDVIQSGIIVHHHDGSILFCNSAAVEILGTDSAVSGRRAEELGMAFFDEAGSAIDPGDYPVYRAITERRAVHDVIMRFQRGPAPCWIRAGATPLMAGDRVGQVVVSFVDITREIEANLRLKENEERLRGSLEERFETEECFRAVFENATVGIVILTPDMQIVNANMTMENMLGYPIDELKTLKLWDISFPDDYEADRELLQDVIEGRRRYYQIEKRYVSQSGAMIWGMLTVSTVRDHAGMPRFIVNMIEDISASKFAEEQLHYLNTHDSMTGLRNRAWFDEEYNRLQFGMHLPVSIVMIDLDGLKQVNDTQGHEAGDCLITGAATILKNAFSGQDIAARIGGDEFGVLLPGVDEEAAAAALVRIRECQAGFNAKSGRPPINFSLGCATALTVDDVAGIWKEADDRMYVQKAARKAARGKTAAEQAAEASQG